MNTADVEIVLRRRPRGTAFTQQKLPEWRPKIEARTISPLFLIAGLLLLPLGALLLYTVDKAKEVIVDYTNCNDSSSTVDVRCADIISKSSDANCTCNVHFTIDKHIEPPVYFYYALTNFYQNHRKYVKSRDDFQLTGKLSNVVSSDCYPYDYVKKGDVMIPIAPCGTIANSLFNDTLSVYMVANGSKVPIPVLRKGIAWHSDKYVKFQNPPGDLKEAFRGFAKPVNWKVPIWELDPSDPDNNGFHNEDFIVWMRTAALPNFRKLYRILDGSQELFRDGLLKGKYILKVNYAYPVISFGGTKSLIITNTTLLGGPNKFIAYLTITASCVLLLFAGILQMIHRTSEKRTSLRKYNFLVERETDWTDKSM